MLDLEFYNFYQNNVQHKINVTINILQNKVEYTEKKRKSLPVLVESSTNVNCYFKLF